MTAPTNKIRVEVDFSVDVRSLAGWPPNTLKAFMVGVAQVISAEREGRELAAFLTPDEAPCL